MVMPIQTKWHIRVRILRFPEVCAVDLNKNIADFSNTNKEVDLVAPGVDIISTYPGGYFAKMSGTSMATPHVSGSMALVKKLVEKEFGTAEGK